MEVYEMTPLSAEEIEYLGTLSSVTVFISIISILVLLGTLSYLCFKTKVPGRFLMLLATLILSLFLIYEQYMGGNLEMVLGPEGMIYSVLAYSVFISVFCFGLIRACRFIQKVSSTNAV